MYLMPQTEPQLAQIVEQISHIKEIFVVHNKNSESSATMLLHIIK